MLRDRSYPGTGNAVAIALTHRQLGVALLRCDRHGEFAGRRTNSKEEQKRQSRNRSRGKLIGLAMCICGACSIIPILGAIAGLASLVLWIVYWVKNRRILTASHADRKPHPVAPLGNLTLV